MAFEGGWIAGDDTLDTSGTPVDHGTATQHLKFTTQLTVISWYSHVERNWFALLETLIQLSLIFVDFTKLLLVNNQYNNINEQYLHVCTSLSTTISVTQDKYSRGKAECYIRLETTSE